MSEVALIQTYLKAVGVMAHLPPMTIVLKHMNQGKPLLTQGFD